jgi:hypothetical protein
LVDSIESISLSIYSCNSHTLIEPSTLQLTTRVEDTLGTIELSDGSFVKPGDVNYAVEAIKNALANSLQAGKS